MYSDVPIGAAPKFVGPNESAPGAELFDPPPFRPGEIVSHIVGGLLNAAVCAIGLIHALRYADLSWTHTAWALCALVTATYLADLASGILHWMFDTWFDETRGAVRRMVLLVREHHIYPQRIFRYGLKQEFGLMSWFGLLGASPAIAASILGAGLPSDVRFALAIAGASYSIELAFSLELHKIGHIFKPGRTIKALQFAHLILSPEHHMKHHSREHDNNYCLVNGWADATLGRIGLFRTLEQIVSTATQARPRENDRRWRLRFGRWVEPDSLSGHHQLRRER
ncbi:TMEM189-like protein [Kribbella steppae]|uniref:TMEM189-like protein n=1 Tax=Kribbella steppae TaxID=2512223 RepID=A0A4R2GWZ6_9ACTN|nr:fatty acid desaturase CarF family protein [Kribbella steppae]TCO15712.1 TMEM189-like protein [Kribbella steppae]